MEIVTEKKVPFFKKYGMLIALLVLAAIFALPTPTELPTAGHRMLGILVFAVIIWLTEAVSYPVSAAILSLLMIICVGFSPQVGKPDVIYGTGSALKMAFMGISASATILVGAALFLAAAMTQTGLDKRIALFILSRIGSKTNRLVAGMILVGIILAFLVPSTTARVGCMVPVILGIVSAFGMKTGSRLAALLMVVTIQTGSIWNTGIKTAAAQNMVTMGFIERLLNGNISWMQWFIAAAPFAIVMSIILYFIAMYMLPPELDEIKGGAETIKAKLEELGAVTPAEKKLLAISAGLILLWVTEGFLHNFDTTTTTILAVTLMLLPWTGIMTWKQAESHISWGTLMLLGVGISMGSALLTTKAAQWLANEISVGMGLADASIFGVFAVISLFIIIIHLGFASGSAIASAMIPIVIAFLQGLPLEGLNIVGLTMVFHFVINFGFILPVNTPQGILAFATDTFSAKDCMKVGIPLTIVGYILLLVFSQTYWKVLGIF
ncbi:DASS family sodium-coupled anion symporter [uncultured Veillonella sp.]|nr:DASS family sodium-coupled anion symporter [uncultured Veillonella sp.]